jgi:hypothetical protein
MRDAYLVLWIESQRNIFLFRLDLNPLLLSWVQLLPIFELREMRWEVRKTISTQNAKCVFSVIKFIPGGDALTIRQQLIYTD